MKLIVGLGNPGFRYRNTRHNAGFLVLKELAAKLRISLKEKKYRGILGKGCIGPEEVMLFLPQTYMNLSGEAVKEIATRHNVPLAEMLVVYDDMDLDFGSLRLREEGGGGGHKGLESIIKNIGSNAFPRLRFGIGRSGRQAEASEYVLSGFSSDERKFLKTLIKEAANCVVMWAEEGPATAMTKFNNRQFA